MDLLKQCQQWFEQNELQKVIAALLYLLRKLYFGFQPK